MTDESQVCSGDEEEVCNGGANPVGVSCTTHPQTDRERQTTHTGEKEAETQGNYLTKNRSSLAFGLKRHKQWPPG